MGEPSLEECRNPPELNEDEEVLDLAYVLCGEKGGKADAIAVLTTNRLIVCDRKGYEVSEEIYPANINHAQITDIRCIKSLLSPSKIEIDTGEQLYTLKKAPRNLSSLKEFSAKAASTLDMERTNWGASNRERTSGMKKYVREGLETPMAVLAIFSGLLFILMGIMWSLSLVGALIGVPMMIIGFLMAGMGVNRIRYGSWSLERKLEWSR